MIVGHAAVAIHLEGYVQLARIGGHRRAIEIYDLANAIDRDRDEMRLARGGAFKFPSQMVPDFRCEGRTGYASLNPMQVVVPYPPHLGALEIAFRAEDVAFAIERLV